MRCIRIGAATAVLLSYATTAAGDVTERQQAITQASTARLETGLLQKPARLDVTSVSLPAALERLQHSAGVRVAYSPTMLADVRPVSCACDSLSVREALQVLLNNTDFEFIVLEDQMVIRRRRPAAGEAAGRPLASTQTPDDIAAAMLNLLADAVIDVRQGTVTGRVTDAGSGQPLVAVQVHIPALNLGGTTSGSGLYSIANVPVGTHEIRFEQIGYRTQASQVVVREGETAVHNVAMREEALALEAIVVTGTAGRSERKAQGAVIASVSAVDVVRSAPITTVGNLLQGRVAGVSLTQGSGVSGTGQQIRIRGASSISISNEPLIYIDGLRADSRIGDGDVSRLDDIDPNQIESIEIVKGPAAATLYGADASAGVIQIITKKGAANTGFRHTIETQFQTLRPGLDSWTNWGRCGAAQINDPALTLCYGAAPGTVVTDDPIARFGVVRDGYVRSGAWSMRGGGEGYRAFTSVAWHSEQGTLPSNEFDRLSGRTNVSYFPTQSLEIGTNLSVTRTRTELPTAGGSGFGHTIALFAGSPITIGGPQNGLRHPYLDFDAIARIDHTQVVTRVVPDLSVRYSPASWFTNRLIVGVDASEMERHVFYPRNDVGYYQRGRDEGEISVWRNNFRRYTVNYLGTLTKQHRRNWASMLSLGTEILAESDDDTFAYGIGLTTNAANAVTSAAEVSGAQERSTDRRVGIFGQWEPSYNDRLFLQFGVRADKFSAFGTAVDWFISPSVRTSYVVSDDPRFAAILPEAISSLRLRGAFGTTGRAPTSGASLITYTPAPFTMENGSVASGVIPLNPGNPGLRAERGREVEAGFDIGLFNDRIAVVYAYFNKVTTDLILQVPQPPSLGFSALPYRNIGKVRNSGHEISINAQVIDRPSFGWNVSVVSNTLNNEVLDLGGVTPFSSIRFEATNRVAEGFPVGAFFTHRIKSFDVANNRAIVSDTLEYLGNLLPGFEGNVSSTIRLPLNLSLYAHFDWKRDVRIYNTTAAFRDHSYANSEYAARIADIQPEERLRRFGPFVSESGQQVNRALVLETYIEPADFLRLNELSLSLDIPERWFRGIKVDRATLQVGGRNLQVWTDFTGLDPDVQNEFDAVAGRADFGSFPSGRRYTARMIVEF